MTAKDVVVGSAIGLHARPAGIISDAAAIADLVAKDLDAE